MDANAAVVRRMLDRVTDEILQQHAEAGAIDGDTKVGIFVGIERDLLSALERQRNQFRELVASEDQQVFLVQREGRRSAFASSPKPTGHPGT